MKIAIVSQPFDNLLPPAQNSVGIWLYHAAQLLSTRHEVTIFCHKGNASGNQMPTPFKLSFLPVQRDRRALRWLQTLLTFHLTAIPAFASDRFYRHYTTEAAQQITANSYDIIHLVNLAQFAPTIRNYNPSAKILLHMHSEWLSQLPKAVIAKRLKAVDMVIGCSHHVVNEFVSAFPDWSDRTAVVANGVSVSDFASNKLRQNAAEGAAKRLLFVGRVSPEKGLHILIEAFREVLIQHPEARLDIVGAFLQLPKEYLVDLSQDEKVRALKKHYFDTKRETYGNHLMDLVKKHNLEQNVTFHGRMNYADIAKCYSNAEILVNPSFSESFGMSLIEAMASGLPVVATSVGGMTDIVVHGETGLLVEAGDSKSLAEALIALVNDSEKRLMFGHAGRRRVEQFFSWEEIVSDLEKTYEKLLTRVG